MKLKDNNKKKCRVKIKKRMEEWREGGREKKNVKEREIDVRKTERNERKEETGHEKIKWEKRIWERERERERERKREEKIKKHNKGKYVERLGTKIKVEFSNSWREAGVFQE